MSAALFHQGPPQAHVGLAPIALERWLTPDDQAAWLPAKAALMDARFADTFAEVAHSRPGQEEAAGLIGAVAAVPEGPAPPLARAARAVSDDLVLVEPGPDGWTVSAISLCSPTYFTAAHALGKALGALHAPVPGGDPDLSGRIARVFSALRPDLVLERFNWTLQAGSDRFTPSIAPLRARAQAAAPQEAARLLHQRVERQTIRRLPQTGGVLFTIRVRLAPLAGLIAAPTDRAAFVRAWTQAPAAFRAYKGWEALDPLVQALLAGEGGSSTANV